MLREIEEAPAVVARLIDSNDAACRALAERLRASPPRFAVTCARGSSDSAAAFAKYVLEIRFGLVVSSVGPSITSIYDVRPRMADALFLTISQSGQSPDLLALAAAAREAGALTVALVNDATSPLAECCEVVLPLKAGAEESVAATKSYLASLAAILQLLAHWSDDAAIGDAVRRLPDDLSDALKRDWQPALPMLRDAKGLYVAGRGPGYAVAMEAALKLKETSGVHGEAISSAELLHGPLVLAGPGFPVILFGQKDPALDSVHALAAALAERAVPVIAAGPGPWQSALTLPTADGLHPFAQPICLMQSFYPIAEALARARDRDPDHPPHLKKVTRTR